ncbi:MAG: hypothetical protein QW228_08940 [Candidatus Aenigmatarchaeota archaeon]
MKVIWEKDKYEEDELPLGHMVENLDDKVVYAYEIDKEFVLESELDDTELQLKKLRLVKRENINDTEAEIESSINLHRVIKTISDLRNKLSSLEGSQRPLISPHIIITQNFKFYKYGKIHGIEYDDLIKGFNYAIKRDIEYLLEGARRHLQTKEKRLNPLALLPYFISKYFLSADEIISLIDEIDEMDDKNVIKRLDDDIKEAIESIDENIKYIDKKLDEIEQKREALKYKLWSKELINTIMNFRDVILLIGYINEKRRKIETIIKDLQYFFQGKKKMSAKQVRNQLLRMARHISDLAYAIAEKLNVSKKIPDILKEKEVRVDILFQELVNTYRGHIGTFDYVNEEFATIFVNLIREVNRKEQEIKDKLKGFPILKELSEFIPYGLQELNLIFSKRFLLNIKENLQKNLGNRKLYTILYVLERGNWSLYEDISLLYNYGVIDKMIDLVEKKYKDVIIKFIVFDIIDLLIISSISSRFLRLYEKQRKDYAGYLKNLFEIPKELIPIVAGIGSVLYFETLDDEELNLRVDEDYSLTYNKRGLVRRKLIDISNMLTITDYRELQFLSLRNFYYHNKDKILSFKTLLDFEMI